jgi:hypothetical protein
LFVSATAKADTIFGLDTPITFGDPGGTAPYLKLTVTDVATNQVELLFETTLGLGNFVRDVYFNYDTANLTGAFTPQHISGADATDIGFSNNGFDFFLSDFDIRFRYPTNVNDGRLGNDDDPGDGIPWFTTSTYLLTYTPTGSEVMDSSSFIFRSQPDYLLWPKKYYFAALIKGLDCFPWITKWGQKKPPDFIPPDNVVVPVPPSLALFLAGGLPFCGLVYVKRRRASV